MFSSWVAREVHGYRAFPINMHPLQVDCAQGTSAASATVTLCIIYAINTFQYGATNRYFCKE
jgi:hypothetical protein